MKLVQIKVLDVLYDDQICNLVYMQDITNVYQEEERKKMQENILMANAYTSKQLQGPQETILILTKQLIENCLESNREQLQAI